MAFDWVMEASRLIDTGPELTESLSLVEFDAERGSFQATYDRARDSASLAVVEVVATALGEDSRDLTPLQTVLDTEALDKLASGSATGPGACDRISFEYNDFEITVTSGGIIEANPIEST